MPTDDASASPNERSTPPEPSRDTPSPDRLVSPGMMVVLAGAIVAGGVVVWTRIAEQNQKRAPVATKLVVVTDETHKVTPAMERSSAAMAGSEVPDATKESSDGQRRSLRAEASRGPVVVVFIKDGCPCSESAQPYYNRLHRAYGETVTFLGVIDREAAEAKAWGERFRAQFPILADPELDLMKAFHATNSAYLALIDGGRIARVWPGYSVDILEEVGQSLAAATGRPNQTIDTSDAPGAPYSGCPFEFAEGEEPAPWEEPPTATATEGSTELSPSLEEPAP